VKPEQTTRQEKIDLQLGRAGWAVGSRRLIQEFLIPSPPSVSDDTWLYRTRNEFADYVLAQIRGSLTPEFGMTSLPPVAAGIQPATRKRIRGSATRELPTPLALEELMRLSWTHLQKLNQKLFVSRYLVALPSAEKLRTFLEADRERIESLMAKPSARKRAPRKPKN
jgi:hypothetical protein